MDCTTLDLTRRPRGRFSSAIGFPVQNNNNLKNVIKKIKNKSREDKFNSEKKKKNLLHILYEAFIFLSLFFVVAYLFAL
jgi:hypothetical protein